MAGLVASLCIHEPGMYGIVFDDPWLKQAVHDVRARIDRVIAELEQGNDEAAARLLLEDPVAVGPGAWDTLPELRWRTLVHNALAWLDYATDPTQGVVEPDELTRISVPVLLTRGGHADLVTSAVDACLADSLPDAEQYTFADAGHIPHLTHPEEFAGVVKGFLDSAATKAEARLT